jgi:glycosyltransferase involved in cell wall biosynthesis
VYPASGGTVELVAEEGGIGVPHPDTFERDEPPAPEALAAAVDRVLADLPRYSASARSRVVERFSLEPWLERHREIFEELAPR